MSARRILSGAFLLISASISALGQGQFGIVITPSSVPNATAAVAYSAQLGYQLPSETNVTGPFSWSISDGSLPAGLSLDPTQGVISGTPTTAGNYSFQVSLTGYVPVEGEIPQSIPMVVATQNYAMLVANAKLSISPLTLPSAFVGTPYSVTLTASGGFAPYTWGFSSSTNADGLTIGANTGIISGTPLAAGTFGLVIIVNDSGGNQLQQPLTLNVAVQLTILNTSFPNGSVGVVYPQQTLSAGGGSPPYRWSINGGALPPGLQLDGVYGLISGTPTSNGTFQFTLVLTDGTGSTAKQTFTIQVGTSVTITTTSLPTGSVGVAYSQTIAATGGTPPYTWSLAAGTLPGGLTLNPSTGVISGTPTGVGSSNFTVQVTDSTKGTAQQPLTITVTVPPLSITTTLLPDGTIGAAYSQTLAATGGTPPYTWSIASGTLPAGLILNASTGAIAGAPTTAATSSFTVKAADSAQGTAQQTLSITVAAPITVTPAALPAAIVGAAYSQTLTFAGGKQPYSISMLGSLPSGFKFTVTGATTATITGTGSTASTANFTVVVLDAAARSQNFSYTLAVNNPTAPTVNVTGIPASSGFQQQVQATISLAGPYPTDIAGTVRITFVPSVTPSAGVDDLLIRFTGGDAATNFRVLNFTIPAGTTTPVYSNASNATIMTGTTAGTINVITDLTSNGADLGSTTKSIVNNSGVPFISQVAFAQTSGGVTVTVTGFSSTRDMVSGLFHFAPATNATLTQSDITVQLGSAYTTYYSNTAQSNPTGTEFTLTMPFTTSGASTSIVSVTVTLTNSKGASNPVSPP